MSDSTHLSKLDEGVDSWNAWRNEFTTIIPDLSGADLSGRNLEQVNFSATYLADINLQGTKLHKANLVGAELAGANLSFADLSFALLRFADLSHTNFTSANLTQANLIETDLREANLSDANLSMAFLSKANLQAANLARANLASAALVDAVLTDANFDGANLDSAIMPAEERNTPGLIGWWSAREAFAHLVIYEDGLVQILESVLGGPFPAVLADMDSAKNDEMVAGKKDKTFDELLTEYTAAHARSMELIEKLSPEKLREVGAIPWYGPEYSLDDFLVYTFYGHKREHAARFEAFGDHLEGKDK